MSIDALSLKYRPKKLSDVIGQPVVVQTLTNSWNDKNWHHAYLLEGGLGSGKCVIGNTLVLSDKGNSLISDIVQNDEKIRKHCQKVISIDGTVGISDYGYFEKNSKTIKLTSDDGFSIEGTSEHPIFTMDKSGNLSWKKLGDIVVGDYACIFRKEIKQDYYEIDTGYTYNSLLEEHVSQKLLGYEETVTCKVCGKVMGNLCTHLEVCNISSDEYKKKFVGSKLVNRNMMETSIRGELLETKIPPKIDKTLSKILGYLVAEGNCYFSHFSFSNTDTEILKDFSKCIKKVFGFKPKRTGDRRNNVISIQINRMIVNLFLSKYLFDYKSASKKVPKEILSSHNDVVASFLSAYFEGDGFVNKAGTMGISSASYELLSQIQILLLRFGIISFLHKKYTKKLSYVDKDYTSWRISISSDNVIKFREKIDFISKRKRKELKDICKKISKDVNPNKDIIPFSQEVLFDIKKQLPILKSGHIKHQEKVIDVAPKYPINCRAHHKTHQNLTYKNMKSILNYFSNMKNIFSEKNINYYDNLIDKTISYIKQILSYHFYYTKIVKIEQDRNDVYDLCKTSDDHSFIANGFVNHNTSTARIMAAMDNCEKGPTLEPCGVCKNCTDIFAGKSIDVCELDAASNRGIDDIRELRSKSYLSPVNSRVKYFIIDEAHSLGGIAAEATLKFIEEPPNNVRILLATTDPQKMKDTIISRCIRLSFNKISWMDLQKHLQNVCSLEKIECNDNASAFIAKTAKGSVRDALQNLQNVSSFAGKNKITLEDAQKVLGFADVQLYFDLIDNIVKIDSMSSTLTIEKIITQGKNIENVIETLSEHLRNLLLARTCGNNIVELGVLEDTAKKYIHQASSISPSVISQMIVGLMDVQRAIILNLNAQFYLEKWVIEAIISVVRNQKK